MQQGMLGRTREHRAESEGAVKRPGPWLAAALIVASVGGCVSSIRKTVGSRDFMLDSAEAERADDLTERDPRSKPLAARCEYWGRAAEQSGETPELSAWLQAKREQACEALAREKRLGDREAASAAEKAERLAAAEKEAQEAKDDAARAAKAKREERAEADRRQAELKEQRKEDLHALALRNLDDLERDIRRLTPQRIDDAQLVLFSELVAKLGQVPEAFKASGIAPTDRENARFVALRTKLQSMAPPYDKAQAAQTARADEQLASTGWEAMKTKLVAPSTAKVAGFRVLLRCAKGAVILYEFDSQNRMGAMIRGRGVVKINDSGGFVAWHEDERALDRSPFVVVVTAANKGNCNQLE